MCTATNNASTFTSPQTTFTIFTTSTIQLYRNIIARLSHQKKREKTLITVYKRILIKKSGFFIKRTEALPIDREITVYYYLEKIKASAFKILSNFRFSFERQI